jgi:hypothetical protein
VRILHPSEISRFLFNPVSLLQVMDVLRRQERGVAKRWLRGYWQASLEIAAAEKNRGICRNADIVPHLHDKQKTIDLLEVGCSS